MGDGVLAVRTEEFNSVQAHHRLELILKTSSIPRRLLACTLAATLSFSTLPTYAHGASKASALSLLPVAMVVTAPALLLSGGAGLTVVAIEQSATGVEWVLERASDGARGSVRLSSQAAAGVSTGVGTAVVFSAVTTGWVLLAAGKAVAFVPNEIGKALLHNERVLP
jgi:hypothetical protein